jgi:uncharacterized protein YggU (UPF0235/DUF167 family)
MRILSRELSMPLATLILTRGVTSRDKDVLVRAGAVRLPELLTRFATRSS